VRRAAQVVALVAGIEPDDKLGPLLSMLAP
jgi:hypothetical protein